MWSLFELFPAPCVIHVVDIGAAIGERPSYQGLVDAGRARVTGFETSEHECKRLNDQYGAPHRFLPYFVGDGADATFHETNWGLTGSLYEPNHALNEKFQNLAEVTTLVRKHPVKTTTLDSIAEVEDPDFIKLDVQGAELSILRNAPSRLAEAVLVQTEIEFVQLYKEQPLFADVDTHMRAAGFQFHTFLGFGTRAFKPFLKNNNPNLGFRQLLWSDAVYVRDWMRLKKLSSIKLHKLAVLLHDVFQSYDTCNLVLMELDRRDHGKRCEQYLARIATPT